jgi:hypothetical protein
VPDAVIADPSDRDMVITDTAITDALEVSFHRSRGPRCRQNLVIPGIWCVLVAEVDS